MFVPEHCMRAIEEGWKREGKAGALQSVADALTKNVTHPGLGGEQCTIEELDRSTMRLIGLHVGVLVGEAEDVFDLIEKLKGFNLYSVPGLPIRTQQYLGDPTLKNVSLSLA